VFGVICFNATHYTKYLKVFQWDCVIICNYRQSLDSTRYTTFTDSGYVTYMLDYSLGWGYGGMHVQSILWHGACSVLLYFILYKLFESPLSAFIGALFWAIHPLRVESVVWIASRKDVVSTFFFLCALLSWVSAGKLKPVMTLWSFVFLLCGAMAKPSVMVFPVFAIAIDVFITHNHKDRHIYGCLMGFSIVLALVSAIIQNSGGACSLSSLIPLWYRCVNAIAALTIYLGNTVWPCALAMQCMIRYPHAPLFSILGIVILCVILASLGYIVYSRFHRCNGDWKTISCGGISSNSFLVGMLIFFCSIVPFLGICGFGIHAFADRFTILPSIGFSIVVSAFLSRLKLQVVSTAIALCLCIGFGVKPESVKVV